MTENVQLAIIGTVQVLGMGWLAYQQSKVRAEVREVKENTNHLTESLVEKTGKLAHAKGMSDQRAKTDATGSNT